MTERSGVYLATVDRAVSVLLKFDHAHPEWTVSELSRALGIHRSIVYRILRTLEQSNVVTRADQKGPYRLGPRLLELANVVLAGMDMRQVAHPVMAELVRRVGVSAFLTVVSGDESVCIHEVDGSLPVRVEFTIGGRYPLHCGASNKVLLAYLPSDKIDRLAASGLKSYSPDTITDPARLREELAKIRDRGWAYSFGELTPGVAALAAPLRDSNRQVVGGVSIAGFLSEFSEDKLPRLVQMTCAAAGDISDRLLAWHLPQG